MPAVNLYPFDLDVLLLVHVGTYVLFVSMGKQKERERERVKECHIEKQLMLNLRCT